MIEIYNCLIFSRHNLTVQSLRLEVEEKNKCIASLETHVASLEQKYSQLETEKADMVYETYTSPLHSTPLHSSD